MFQAAGPVFLVRIGSLFVPGRSFLREASLYSAAGGRDT
jgi:hypothetical protein